MFLVIKIRKIAAMNMYPEGLLSVIITIRKYQLSPSCGHKQKFREYFICIAWWSSRCIRRLIGPHTLRAWVSYWDCLNFLRRILRTLLEAASFNTRFHIWFQHDAASPLYSREMGQWLSENDLGCYIGRGGEVPVLWPSRSSDLNPLDLYVGIFENKCLRQYNWY
jgi:hypothetical protein